MSASIPTFKTLITVQEFRDLVKKHFADKISEGQVYDARDLERFNTIDDYTLMFIQHGQFGETLDQDRALRVFDGSLSWRKRHNVFDISTSEFPASFIERKAVFFKNVDKYNHPILHFVVRNFNKGQDDIEEVKRFITYSFEQHLRDHPGQKIVIIFDMSETGLTNLDYTLVKFIIASIQVFYPGLLAYLLMLKMPWLLSAAWKLFRTWMASEADQFIRFVDTTSILDYISPDQLPIAMGGTANEN